MTCQQIHSHFENPLLVEAVAFNGPAEVSEHVDTCGECNCFVETQKELAVNLRLAHQSAPPFPPSLDRAVLANYRQYLADRNGARSAPVRKRLWPISILAWAAALAAAIVIAQEEVLLFFPGTTTLLSERQSAVPTVKSTEAPNMLSTSPVVRRKQIKKEQALSSVRERAFASFSLAEPDSVPPTFNSLLYCDQLSCAGAMELIRVQLPSPVLRGSEDSRQANVVSADVLVGSDGIARAIRIVE